MKTTKLTDKQDIEHDTRITVGDIEAYCRKEYSDQDAADHSEPRIMPDISYLVDNYPISTTAARRYFELSGLDHTHEFVEADMQAIFEAKLRAKFLKLANGDEELADALMKLDQGAYKSLGTFFMINPLLHWAGFLFIIVFFSGMAIWMLVDIITGSHNVELWKMLLIVSIPFLMFPFVLKQHRQFIKLGRYRKVHE